MKSFKLNFDLGCADDRSLSPFFRGMRKVQKLNLPLNVEGVSTTLKLSPVAEHLCRKLFDFQMKRCEQKMYRTV